MTWYRTLRWNAALVLILSLVSSLQAQAQTTQAASITAVSEEISSQKPTRFATFHEWEGGGVHLHYQAVVEEHFVFGATGKKLASIYTTSYVRTDTPANVIRPVTFVFNGGPGAASLWLHMGFIGPKRVVFADSPNAATVPPFEVVANPDSPLNITDLVLIDPPGTGFSRILADGKPEDFYGVSQDAKAIADLILIWIRQNNRWNSPRFLIGESYGTIRAAAVARLLAGGPTETGGMDSLNLNGIIILGQDLDASAHAAGNDRVYLDALPTFAATACYFGRVDKGCSAKKQFDDANAFAADQYLKALYAGATLAPAERDEVAAQLAKLTGLSRDFILANNLRVSPTAFARGLLRQAGQQIGMYDTRYILPIESSGNDPVSDDPAMGRYSPGFIEAFNVYQRNDLRVTLDATYEPIDFRAVNSHWNYGSGPGLPSSHNYARDLAVAMRRNPDLRLMVGTGYYDLATPLGNASYTINHSGIPLDRTVVRLYPSGHMVYMGAESREALAKDVRAFITGSSSTSHR